MNISINEKAPTVAKNTITIIAPVEIVWKVLTSINNWPQWQTDVTESKLMGELAEGTLFIWKAGGLKFESKIHTINENNEFGWTGKTFGASAIHNWKFKEENGRTTVDVEECLEGVFPFLFKKYFQKNLDSGMKKNLKELKSAAEKQNESNRMV